MKKTFDRKRFIIYLWIALGWALLWMFSYVVNFSSNFFPRWINEIWRGIYLVSLHFFLLEYVLPYIWQKKKNIITQILIGLFLIWVMMMLYSFGLYAWRAIGIRLNIYTPLVWFPERSHAIAYHSGFAFGSIFFFAVILHLYDYRQLRLAAQKLRMEKQEAELNYLKSQTNPHFLFNTLNNIYSLSREKSDLAPESIMRLSKILRFMLYETSGDYIAIEQELKIISDYIALEKLRYDESLSVNYNYDIEDMKQAIPPLLLIPLIENAFKHGASETRNRPFIDIHISVRNRQLSLQVKNSTEKFTGDRTVKENIGLSNLKRQLELLYTDYNLNVEQGDDTFTATLKINLSSHVKN